MDAMSFSMLNFIVNDFAFSDMYCGQSETCLHTTGSQAMICYVPLLGLVSSQYGTVRRTVANPEYPCCHPCLSGLSLRGSIESYRLPLKFPIFCNSLTALAA